MAKKKGKVDLIEKTLDGEIAASSGVDAAAPNAAPSEKSEEKVVAAAAPEASSRTKKTSFKLQFFGRDYVAEHFPKSLDLADRFAKEWIDDGSFEFLPVANPRAKTVLIMGLKNIRAAEKKVEQAYQEKLAPIVKERVAPFVKTASERVEKFIEQVRS